MHTHVVESSRQTPELCHNIYFNNLGPGPLTAIFPLGTRRRNGPVHPTRAVLLPAPARLCELRSLVTAGVRSPYCAAMPERTGRMLRFSCARVGVFSCGCRRCQHPVGPLAAVRLLHAASARHPALSIQPGAMYLPVR